MTEKQTEILRKTIIKLRDVDKLKWDEIAKKVKISRSMTWNHYCKGLQLGLDYEQTVKETPRPKMIFEKGKYDNLFTDLNRQGKMYAEYIHEEDALTRALHRVRIR